MHDKILSCSGCLSGAAAAAFTDTDGDARGGARLGGSRECGEVAKGTPPSNTVPSNYNPDSFHALRYGVDSLYVSYPGVLSEEWDHKLSDLKDLAQSENETEQALAQVVIGEHVFEVRDKGRGRFAYMLVDNCYHLQASNKNSKSLPMAYVQISSEYLGRASRAVATLHR